MYDPKNVRIKNFIQNLLSCYYWRRLSTLRTFWSEIFPLYWFWWQIVYTKTLHILVFQNVLHIVHTFSLTLLQFKLLVRSQIFVFWHLFLFKKEVLSAGYQINPVCFLNNSCDLDTSQDNFFKDPGPFTPYLSRLVV